MFAKFKEFDLYRKIPKDLTESTRHGTTLSICASVFMLVLFIAELWAFLSVQVATNIVIDPNAESLLRINFNITLLDVPCEYAVIDVVDVLGAREENVTKNINKWKFDSSGLNRGFSGSADGIDSIMHDTHHNLQQLNANGIHAYPIDKNNFDSHLSRSEFTFVNFYAPWCIWCQRLEPIWEAFAERVSGSDMQISIVKVDCVANKELCMDQKIQAFPLLRLFHYQESMPPDYRSDRTVDSLMKYVEERHAFHRNLLQLPAEDQEKAKEEMNTDHPACQLAGYLLVNRVPGHFHIEARSKLHNLNPYMANLSHIVHHLSFGNVLPKRITRKLDLIPSNIFSIDSTHPLDEHYYMMDNLHQATHHYIKVVSTQVEASRKYSGSNAIQMYQMVESSQTMTYDESKIPEARFSYDISPMAVVVQRKGKHWYVFITSICALIGGTFTVVGLLSGTLSVIFKPKKL